MGKIVRVGEKQKKDEPGWLTRILGLLIFVVLLGAYVLHQCAMFQGVTYKIPPANRFLGELQEALAAYNERSVDRYPVGDPSFGGYPVGELSFSELDGALSSYYQREYSDGYTVLSSFKYSSVAGTTYKITAQLDTKKEIIQIRTPDDMQ